MSVWKEGCVYYQLMTLKQGACAWDNPEVDGLVIIPNPSGVSMCVPLISGVDGLVIIPPLSGVPMCVPLISGRAGPYQVTTE